MVRPSYLSNGQLPPTVTIVGLIGDSTTSDCGFTRFRLLCQGFSNLELESKLLGLCVSLLLLLEILKGLECFQSFCFKVF